MTTQKLRNSARYTKNRLRCLVRDDFTCQFPGCRVRRLNRLTAHHVTPLSNGGTHDLDNLATVCADHHEAIHQQAGGVERFRQVWERQQAGLLQLVGGLSQ